MKKQTTTFNRLHLITCSHQVNIIALIKEFIMPYFNPISCTLNFNSTILSNRLETYLIDHQQSIKQSSKPYLNRLETYLIDH